MDIQKHVTSLSISKRLKELGVKQESIHYWQYIEAHDDYEIDNGDEEGSYSAFLASELGELLPDGFHSWKGMEESFTGKDSNYWCVKFTEPELDSSYEKWIEADTEANVRGKMLIYLLENNLLST